MKKFEKIDKELKNSQDFIKSLQEEKAIYEKKLEKLQNEEKGLQNEVFQLKERNYLLEEDRKNAEKQYNSVFFKENRFSLKNPLGIRFFRRKIG